MHEDKQIERFDGGEERLEPRMVKRQWPSRRTQDHADKTMLIDRPPKFVGVHFTQ